MQFNSSSRPSLAEPFTAPQIILPTESGPTVPPPPTVSDTYAGTLERITLQALLKKSPGIPAHNALLGVCEDSLPVLFDLQDSSLGALLAITGSPQTAFELLGTLAFSTAALNPARQVQVLVVSSRPEEWQVHPALTWAKRSIIGIYNCFEREAEESILRAAEWARQVQLGQRRGAQLLLILDDLAACAEMDFDARLNLEWLLREGSGSGVRTIAAVSGTTLLDIASWVPLFSTRLLGEIEDRRVYHTLNLLDPIQEFPVLGENGLATCLENGWFVFQTVQL